MTDPTSQCDEITSFNTGIGEPHREIHEGEHFFNAPLFSAAVVGRMAYTTGAKYVHALIGVSSNQPGIAQVYEAPTLSAEGTADTIFNSNLPSSKTPTMASKKTPTVTGTGTLLFSLVVGSSGNVVSRVGGSSDRESEVILKPSTQYLVVFTPDASADFVIDIEFYEKSTNGIA